MDYAQLRRNGALKPHRQRLRRKAKLVARLEREAQEYGALMQLQMGPFNLPSPPALLYNQDGSLPSSY
jgi:hypothetical protein